jgi:myo-inositol catabolism protein IolC
MTVDGLSRLRDGARQRTWLEVTSPAGTWLERPLGLPTSRPDAIEPIAKNVTCQQRECANFVTIRPQGRGRAGVGATR